MTQPRSAATAPKAPGPSVVEALQHPITAELANIACQEAHDARMRELTADGRQLDRTEAMKLRLLSSLGEQLVTATTVPTGGTS